MAKMTMVQALNLALRQELEADDSVLILGEDVGIDGGVFRVTDQLIHQFGEHRVVDTPLAESAIVGTAIGMAMAGLKPVVEMQFSGFSYLAIGQLEGNASRYRSRTQGQYTVPMVMRMPYGGGVRALEHHSESREAFFAHTPGLKVVIPSGPRNARALLAASIRDPDPVVFMEPKHAYRAFKEEVPDEPETMELGKSAVIQSGDALTVVAWGAMTRPALKAAREVGEERGIDIEVIDLLTVNPIDSATLNASVEKTGRCVIVQEAPRSLGVASELVSRINDETLFYLEAPIKRVTGYDVVTPYFGREKAYIPTLNRIRRGIEETLDY